MPNWDIFHSDRLEIERDLSPSAVRGLMAKGEIVDDDLARPAGSGEPWARLADNPDLAAALAAPEPPTLPGPSGLSALIDDEGEDEDDEESDLSRFVIDPDLVEGDTIEHHRGPSYSDSAPLPSGVRKATTEDLDPTGFPDSYDRDLDLSLRPSQSVIALDADPDAYDPAAEDEEAAEFTFTRGGAETVEELDLAAMVDVAFQLVLFFLVTASTVVFKALEVPKPNPEQAKGAATQSTGRTLDDLQKDYILVEIDPAGAVKIDHESGPNDFEGLAAKLRELRLASGRGAMLLTADSATLHKYAVLAYDAANEIGLKIAIAQPKPAPAQVP